MAINNANGTASADTIYLTLPGNDINGLGGNDTILPSVSAGYTLIDGGDGIDLLSFELYTSGVRFFFDAVGFASTVEANDDTSHLLSQFFNIENARGTKFADEIWGNEADNVFWGGDGNDSLIGGEGNDTLDGGTGGDDMYGGMGDDTYFVDNSSDLVDEDNFEAYGIDTVRASISFSLANTEVVFGEVENLTLLGSGNINGTGNDWDNVIIGNAGANKINGKEGVDTMSGGAGNDTYVVDGELDIVDEKNNGGGGTDTVQSSVSFSLANSATVLGTFENLTLIGTDNTDGTGNSLNNAITGNAGANKLNGKGGVDTMTGGAGNDTYYVDKAGDVVVETSTGGTSDWVATSVSYALSSSAYVEKLSTTSSSGTAAINLTGNGITQTITGNAGANKIDGKGGADTMRGGGGNDTYIVDNAGDVIVESSTGGTSDWVATSVSYALSSSAYVEKLSTTSSASTTAINLTGNSIAQAITGNAGANIINGSGGNDTLIGGGGNDKLTGGAGNDTFLFNSAVSATTNVDKISDFNVAADTIRLENAIFIALTALGTLASGAFASNSTGLAGDSSDRIIYEKDTGELYYDANGSGAGGGIHFATLTGNLSLTNADFFVI
ncbi:Ca2+-binding RTX toxin-like protein [Pararhizobium capsulatum DSM 1112]|uniref:Ca2+-binding RTX toxin-like protein n=1 Tax=Pararhizobium capsulatum DSM 1112 TaxID=1121113 RepID=A0ABU0C0D3_9HYPH|nr:calcium-binding protein [Pararhizobium capsulatum]MDQ0323983.1 Ca2+-binding RTX toxin-like protein [Pararhizobium capsulatum DSM 1112]